MMNIMILCPIALELREEVENTAGRLHYINEAHQTVKDDISLTKRATEKTHADLSRAEKGKLDQANSVLDKILRSQLSFLFLGSVCRETLWYHLQA